MAKASKLLLIVVLLWPIYGCDNRQTKEANDFASRVFRAWNYYTGELERKYEQAEMPEMPEVPQVIPEGVSEKIGQETAKIAEQAGAAAATAAAQQTAKQVGHEIDDVKDTAASASNSAKQAARSAKRTASYYVRKLPRSQREANEMTVEYGRSWADRFNEWLKQIGANGGIFGRRGSSVGTSGRSRSPKSRLKGRERL